MLTADMKRVIQEQRLGFVATTGADGAPNFSPKGTFVVLDDETIAFGDIRSPGTIRNLLVDPRIEVNIVDPFARKGYRFAGIASVTQRGDDGFEVLLDQLQSSLGPRVRSVVTITVTRAQALTSPSYDAGRTEAELRRSWTQRYRLLQPNERFEE